MAAPTVSIVSPSPISSAPTDDETGRYCLAVAGPHARLIQPLPRTGFVTIGRAEHADLRVPDPSVSRYHSRLHIRDGFFVEDLGSHNGTFVRDTRIPANQPIPLHPGDALGIGDTLITIRRQRVEPAANQPATHAHFEARLIEECAHLEGLDRCFVLVRVDLPSDGAPIAAEAVFRSLLRPGDLCAVYAPARYELLFVDTDHAAAESLVATLTSRLHTLDPGISVGAAYAPGSGRSPGELFAKACAAVRRQAPTELRGEEAIVADPRVLELYRTAGRAAQGDIAILIHGETGVGKEFLASAVHRASRRAAGPFVPFNCAALTESLLESELFGHERGAFTGAHAAKAGLFETASGGTLFLDEIGEMSATVQAKLLRVLETRQVQRVGASRPFAVDVRVVSATNRDLEAEVAAGRFRHDLYYRLNGVVLTLPPLRERPSEIAAIARMVVEKTACQIHRAAPGIHPDVLELLLHYPWPGNIRELRNVMERATLLCGESTITLDHLPEEKMRLAIGWEHSATKAAVGPGAPDRPGWWLRREEEEKVAMREALDRCQGNRTRAAELLAMPRSTFMRKLADLDLKTGGRGN